MTARLCGGVGGGELHLEPLVFGHDPTLVQNEGRFHQFEFQTGARQDAVSGAKALLRQGCRRFRVFEKGIQCIFTLHRRLTAQVLRGHAGHQPHAQEPEDADQRADPSCQGSGEGAGVAVIAIHSPGLEIPVRRGKLEAGGCFL